MARLIHNKLEWVLKDLVETQLKDGVKPRKLSHTTFSVPADIRAPRILDASHELSRLSEVSSELNLR
jgi:hypothetical protein